MERIPCESVVLDLDGTLWNPMEMSLEAWRRACLHHQVDPTILLREHFAQAFGQTAHEVAEIVLPGIGAHDRRAILETANSLEIQLIGTGLGELFEGVERTLDQLSRSKRLFLCSNCQSGYIEAFLHTYGFAHFIVDSICSGDTMQDKSINLGLLIDRNTIGDAVMVGDMRTDSEAARMNNLPFIYASYGFGDLQEFAAKIDRIDELPQILV